VGNAGNISAYWTGYSEYAGVDTAACVFHRQDCAYQRDAVTNRRPKMLGYQASGAAPFLRGGPVADPETVATAIRIGNPQSWDLAWAASRESGGWFAEFDDAEILATQKLLAEREGIFCEPASAISVAGAIRDIKNGRIEPGCCVVCTITGHGLKDSDTAIKQSATPVIEARAMLADVQKAILDHLD
jgi:threonine synthase